MKGNNHYNLLFYGPPAVGKETISKIIAASLNTAVITTNDARNYARIQQSIKNTEVSEVLTSEFRTTKLKANMENKKSSCLTFVFSGTYGDISLIDNLISISRFNDFDFVIIRLFCSLSILEKRLSNFDRLGKQKVVSTDEFLKNIANTGLNPIVPFPHLMHIDTSTDVAENISKIILKKLGYE